MYYKGKAAWGLNTDMGINLQQMKYYKITQRRKVGKSNMPAHSTYTAFPMAVSLFRSPSLLSVVMKTWLEPKTSWEVDCSQESDWQKPCVKFSYDWKCVQLNTEWIWNTQWREREHSNLGTEIKACCNLETFHQSSYFTSLSSPYLLQQKKGNWKEKVRIKCNFTWTLTIIENRRNQLVAPGGWTYQAAWT